MKRFVFIVFLSCTLSAAAHEDVTDQIQALTQQIQTHPGQATLYFERGELFRSRGIWKKAEADFLQAEQLDPELYSIDFSLGLVQMEEGNNEEALFRLNRFLDRQPGHSRALIARARVHMNLGSTERAIADYTGALSGEPQPEIYLARSQIYKGLNQNEQALSSLEEGLQRLGPLVVLEQEAADLEVRMNRYDSALRRVDQLIATAERKESLLFRRGEILEQAGRKKDALVAFSDAAAAIQSLPASRKSTGSMIQLENQIQSAIARLSQ